VWTQRLFKRNVCLTAKLLLALASTEHLGSESQGTHDFWNCLQCSDRLCGLVVSSWLHDGDVLWFLWGTNWIYICYVEESRQPLWSSGQSSWLQNRDVLWFLWGTSWIYICYVEESRPPLWPSGQSSWLHNGDILWFLRGTNWIYIGYVEESRQPLWSSGQSSYRSRSPGSITGATRFSKK
jgi:hypothetical protein